MENRNTSLRRAAVLIASLDTAGVDAVLEQMSAAQAARLRAAIMELGDVTEDEEREVIETFLQGNRSPSRAASLTAANERDEPSSTDDSTDSLATARTTDARDPQPEVGPRAARDSHSVASRFDFLRDAEIDTLVLILGREHPQTIALVLSHLTRERAADVLSRLSAGQQVEVLRRIAHQDATDPEVLSLIATDLEELFRGRDGTTERSSPRTGVGVAREILRAAGHVRRREIQLNLMSSDRQLACSLGQPVRPVHGPRDRGREDEAREELDRDFDTVPSLRVLSPSLLESPDAVDMPSVDFDELTQLEPRDWLAILEAADRETFLIAMAGASQALIDVASRKLPYGARRRLRREIRDVGPLRLSDIREAQRQLARTAASLMARGIIHPPPPRRFTVAA